MVELKNGILRTRELDRLRSDRVSLDLLPHIVDAPNNARFLKNYDKYKTIRHIPAQNCDTMSLAFIICQLHLGHRYFTKTEKFTAAKVFLSRVKVEGDPPKLSKPLLEVYFQAKEIVSSFVVSNGQVTGHSTRSEESRSPIEHNSYETTEPITDLVTSIFK